MTLRSPSLIRGAALLVLLALPHAARASGAHETTEFSAVSEKVRLLAAEHGPKNVLLVCDIDNTLLAMNHDLGSDQWFEWQSFLLKHRPGSPHLVADDFPGLLAAQGRLFTLGKMHPPEPDLPKQIDSLQALGVWTLVLTSRGDDFRVATKRELEANGYDFAKTTLPISDPPCDVYAPYDVDNIEASGLTDDEVKRFGLKSEPRGVSFGDGVFMTAGQHKGAMLLTMLARSRHDFKAIVFVDDHGRHVLRVYDALVRRGLNITTFHYKREDDNVKRFEYGDKKDVSERWLQLDGTLQTVFE